MTKVNRQMKFPPFNDLRRKDIMCVVPVLTILYFWEFQLSHEKTEYAETRKLNTQLCRTFYGHFFLKHFRLAFLPL